MFKKRYLTLVEVLIVFSVLFILSTLMMPSLKYSYKRAFELTCRQNLKHLTLSVQVYESDYSFLPTYGAGEYFGAFSSTAMLELYSTYMGGGADFQSSAAIGQEIENAPKRFFVCPANPKDNYARNSSYGLYAGSVNSFGLTSNRAIELFYDFKQNVQSLQGRMPSLWADRCIVNVSFPFATLEDSNHKIGELCEGGFVSYMDGSVDWSILLDSAINEENLFIRNGAINGAIRIPNSSLFFRADSNGNLKYDFLDSEGTILNIYVGSTIKPFN